MVGCFFQLKLIQQVTKILIIKCFYTKPATSENDPALEQLEIMEFYTEFSF